MMFYDFDRYEWKYMHEPCFYGGLGDHACETSFASDVQRDLFKLFRKFQCCLFIERNRAIKASDLTRLFKIVYHFEGLLIREMKMMRYQKGEFHKTFETVNRMRREYIADVKKQYNLNELDDDMGNVGLVPPVGDQK